MVLVSNIVHCRKGADQQAFRRAVPAQNPEEQRGGSGFSDSHLKVNILCWMKIMRERMDVYIFGFKLVLPPYTRRPSTVVRSWNY